MKADEFAAHIDALSRRVLEALKPGAPVSAWELKLALKVSQSHMLLALGVLLRDGRVRVIPEQLTFLVELQPPEAAEDTAAAPFEAAAIRK